MSKFILCLVLVFLFYSQIEATIVNQLAFDISQTQSIYPWDLNLEATLTVSQTFRPTSAKLDGIAVYLDRMGLSSSTDSVRLQLRTTDLSGRPTEVVLATAWVKMTDIPDGNLESGDLQPDNLTRGYQVWFIFNQPVSLRTDSTYAFTLNARRTDSSNRVICLYGTNGYAAGNGYFRGSSGSWGSLDSDLNFMTIKDKYSLIGIRRLPWNYNGVMTIESDIDYTSAPSYTDSLGRFLQTDANVGGRWGRGVNGKIPIGSLWFWNAGNGIPDSLGIFGQKVPFYFNGTDTLSRFYGDSLDQWIQRGWITSAHTVGHTGYNDGGPGLDSSHVFKALSYMQNHGLDKIYKAGVWVSHSGNYINTERYGATPGTPYYHANKTFAPGKFKFLWDSPLQESWFLYHYDIHTRVDSLNVAQVIFDPLTLPDGVTRTYRFKRNGNWDDAVPERTYAWFNKAIASSVANDWQIYIYYTHFGKNNGLTSTSIDSIRAVHQIKDSLGIWIPNSKDILNQQAASAFAQVKVENINGKRTINITTLKDWSWGSHVPDPEELYYLTFDCFAAESLDIMINGTTKLEVQKGKDFTEVKPEWQGWGDVRVPMYWYAKNDRKFDKLMVIPGQAVPINYPPVLDSIRAKTVNEGQVLSLRVHATDANGDRLILNATNIPLNATFTDSGNGAGSFRFSPSYLQSGVYTVTFFARDTVGAVDSELVPITVVNVNNPPVLDSIGAKNLNEGQILSFRIHSMDINGDRLILNALNIPSNAVFTDSGNGAGSFRFSPNYTQSGIYNVTFIARDTVGAADTELVHITVINVNNPPVLDSIGSKSVTEGQILTFRVHSTDINGDSLILSALNIPANAIFIDSTRGTGSFRFSPDYTQAGAYNITIIARDTAGAADSEVVAITVIGAGNQTPVLDSIGPRSVNEGSILTIRVHATDADRDSMVMSMTNLPANAVFTDSGNGSGLFRFNPNYVQAGLYHVTFKATDPSSAIDSEIVAITVINVNNPPVLDSIGAKNLTEGQVLAFRIHAFDINGDRLLLSALNVPTNATFTDSTNGAGSFTFSPNYFQAGTYNVTFISRDTVGAADSELVQITVNNLNHDPVLDPIGPKIMDEGTNLVFRVHATDVDAESLRLTVTNLPLNAAFVDSGNGAGSFYFSPSCSQAGIYNVHFKVVDPYLASDSEIVQITVNSQHSPSLSLPADSSYKLCNLGDSIFFRISASDLDRGDSLTLTKISTDGELRPSNPVRGIDSLSGNFFWRPVYADTLFNSHLLIFRVTDKCGHIVVDTVQIRIRFNHPPVLTSQDSSYSLCQDSTVCFDHLIGSDSDPDDSLSLTLISGPRCLFLTTMIRPNLLTGFNCFQTSGTNSVYTFIFELKDKCGAVDRDTVYIRVRPPANLIAGDPNGDLLVTVSDVVYIINYLFKSGPPPVNCPRSGDANCDGKVTVSDAIYLINYLFKGGTQPCR
ncbi:MAG TPA: tandem-95 repeat protein [Terriglobales bacterium]|nr:tandem-95 repeat protein [Terriglobales bacterium]